MLTQDTIEAYNTRLTVDLNSIKKMTAGELDRVKAHGSQAEALLKNKELALFIHQFKFEVTDSLGEVNGHSPDDNARRVALANQLTGIDSFITTLKRAVYIKNRIVTQQNGSAEPSDI